MKVTGLAVGALLALTAGCATHGLIRAMDVPPEGAAQLTIVRLPVIQGSGQTWVISVDEHAVLGIRAGEHATFAVSPGDRIVTSDCVTAFPTVRPSNPVRVPVQVGRHYYVTLGACAMAGVTATTAGPLLKQSRELVLKP